MTTSVKADLAARTSRVGSNPAARSFLAACRVPIDVKHQITALAAESGASESSVLYYLIQRSLDQIA